MSFNIKDIAAYEQLLQWGVLDLAELIGLARNALGLAPKGSPAVSAPVDAAAQAFSAAAAPQPLVASAAFPEVPPTIAAQFAAPPAAIPQPVVAPQNAVPFQVPPSFVPPQFAAPQFVAPPAAVPVVAPPADNAGQSVGG